MTDSYYNQYARAYDEATFSFSRFAGLEDELRAFISEVGPGVILDLGCGSGRDLCLFSSTGRKVVGLDKSWELLALAAAHLKEIAVSPQPSSMLIRGDLGGILPFQDDVFAAVVASGSLLHLPRLALPDALGEIRRILRPQGIASISLKNGAGEEARGDGRVFTYYDESELLACAESIGFASHNVRGPIRRDWLVLTVTK